MSIVVHITTFFIIFHSFHKIIDEMIDQVFYFIVKLRVTIIVFNAHIMIIIQCNNDGLLAYFTPKIFSYL